jgi:hypothetical protein
VDRCVDRGGNAIQRSVLGLCTERAPAAAKRAPKGLVGLFATYLACRWAAANVGMVN